MYAVIRAGGKQYRVAPGDVIKIEKTSPTSEQTIEFSDILAVSGDEGKVGKSGNARVIGQVLGDGRADKVLVFHFKRKKQYKKLNGHRQPFTQVRIAEISFDGQRFTAPELQAKPEKKAKAGAAATTRSSRTAKPAAKTPAKKTAAKKTTKKK